MEMVPVAASSTTEAATTEVVVGWARERKVPASMVLGSIRKPDGTWKVALTEAFGQTPVWFADGLVDCTVMLPATAAAAAVVKVHT